MTPEDATWPDVVIHPKFWPLLTEPHTYAVMYGGRGGMKTEQVLKCAITIMTQHAINVLVCRETYSSIADSCHSTVERLLRMHGLLVTQGGSFEVTEKQIRRLKNGEVMSKMVFGGIRKDGGTDHKGKDSISLTIVEEAQEVSQESWDILIPTVIRAQQTDSGWTPKMWIPFNPGSVADPTWKEWVLYPRPDTITIQTSYEENPWLTFQMKQEAEHKKETDLEAYEHIWLGKPRGTVKGAIFGEEMKAAQAEGRIGNFPYHKGKPVHTIWDMGMDRNVVWFAQAYDGNLYFIDYYANFNEELTDTLIEVQSRKYMYGIDYVPGDAHSRVIHRNGIMGKNPDIESTPFSILLNAGRKPEVIAVNLVRDQISAARRRFPQCKFDAVKCAEGVLGLQSYRWDRDVDESGQRKPEHDFASHPASAFMGACIKVKERIHRPIPVVHTGYAEADI